MLAYSHMEPDDKGLACIGEGPVLNALCNAELPVPVNIHPCFVAARFVSSPATTAEKV